jgi:PAS domain S-box-containing protein
MLDSVRVFEFGAAFDALDIGVIVIDERRCIVGCNDWIARVSGCARDAALGRTIGDLFPMISDGRLPAVIEDSFQFGSSSILTHSLNALLPLHGEGGAELLHNIIVRPISSNLANFCLLQVNDVTVSVTRERVLRERQNARYRAIVDSAPDAIITTDMDRKIQWVNGAAERVFGFAPEELLGQQIDVLLEEAVGLAAAVTDDERGAKEGERTFQVTGRRKRGVAAHFEVSLARWKADERSFVTTIWRDVTERRAADLALRESEGRHRALSEALPQLVWTSGADGSCDYFNPQWEDYTGGPAQSHLGSGWLEVIHEIDRAGLAAAWAAAVASGTVFDSDARLRAVNGSYRWFKMRSIPVRTAEGTITKWFGTATEITEFIEARDSLRRSNEELEARVVERTREREVALAKLYESQKMESIGQLTGGVAHDFNNLLAVILGSLSLLKKGLPDDLRTSRLLEGAIHGAERGAILTKRLLAFARRQELKLEAVSVQKLVPDILDFLRQSVGPNIAIVIDTPPDVAPVKIDANQFELALINLAVNARDAMPNGGTLTITCRNKPASELQEAPAPLIRSDYVCISISDTGEGMSEVTLAKAMEPFFTTKGVGKGTGLGLSMVQGLTVQSGGAMQISSALGKGTVVTLWLPRARIEDAVQPSAALSTSGIHDACRKLQILLVDDDALVSMNSAYMLMDLGHSVVEASSAARALELIESDAQFDIMVTDYAMPTMNGLDLATRIRRIKPKLPIVLATGYAELPPSAVISFQRLAKPFTQKELAETLEAALKLIRD